MPCFSSNYLVVFPSLFNLLIHIKQVKMPKFYRYDGDNQLAHPIEVTVTPVGLNDM